VSGMLFGMETEYAVHSPAGFVSSTEREALVWQLIDVAREQLKTMRDFGGGMFLENGSRLYIDCGQHPELSTPECTDPWQVVRYILAGEKILLNVARQIEGIRGEGALGFLKCNVDYSGAGTTWGCHESYLHRMSPDALSAEIIPHLVSRVIYTGAGGFNSLAPGLTFTISPRVPHLEKVVSEHSTSARGIFHTKDESLSREGYHRLHLICGESLCSQTAMWLKVATTALVVAMAEAGICVSNIVGLSAPLTALAGFATDPTCQAKAIVANKGWMTAIEIQRVYLKCAEAHLRDSFMPEWAGEACRQWRMILDRLEKGYEGVNTTLDWAIKLSLYRDYAKRQGIAWETLRRWTRIHKRLDAALGCPADFGGDMSLDTLFQKGGPVLDEIRDLRPYLRKHGLRWEDLNKFIRLRKQLFEIDTRFGELGDRGIFSKLAGSGVLAHEMADIGDIRKYLTSPPPTGRARVRGRFIGQVTNYHDRYECDWQGIWDPDKKRFLDLSDPFTSKEQWHLMERTEECYMRAPPLLRERMRRLEVGGY
jgi:proteasome accessory factor A